jgi:ADP-ribosylglycohydrolase
MFVPRLESVLASAVGGAVADASGMPFETMTADEISRTGITKIEVYHSPGINPHALSDTKKLKCGQFTDDTVLARAVRRSIICDHGLVSMDTIAHYHANNLDHIRGFGKTTITAIKEIRKGVHWSRSGQYGGIGAGVLMKISPLAVALSKNSDQEIWDIVVPFGQMTHLEMDAIVPALLHLFMLQEVFDYAVRESVPGNAYTAIGCYFNARNRMKRLNVFAPKTEEVLRSLDAEICRLDRFGGLQTPRDVGAKYGATAAEGFSAPGCLGMAYASFLKNPNDFSALSGAIYAGRDTDTVGVLVGELLGARHGLKIFPENLLRELEDVQEIMGETIFFYKACFGTI